MRRFALLVVALLAGLTDSAEQPGIAASTDGTGQPPLQPADDGSAPPPVRVCMPGKAGSKSRACFERGIEGTTPSTTLSSELAVSERLHHERDWSRRRRIQRPMISSKS